MGQFPSKVLFVGTLRHDLLSPPSRAVYFDCTAKCEYHFIRVCCQNSTLSAQEMLLVSECHKLCLQSRGGRLVKDNLFCSFFSCKSGGVWQSRWAEFKAFLQNITYIHSVVVTLGVLQSCNVALKDENLVLSTGEENPFSTVSRHHASPYILQTRKFFGECHMNILFRFIAAIIIEHAQQVEFFLYCMQNNQWKIM